VLDFDMHARAGNTPVKQLVAGRAFGQSVGGFVAVANVGTNSNWLGHHLAMANLYGFGRLAWDPGLSSELVAEEWARLTFSDDPQVVSTVVGMLLDSWPAYERYTGPLGAGTLTDIIGVHYGPAIESSERNGWGQWHRADEKGIGMDRTVATGTGFIGQYRRQVAEMYESLTTCPDELLLFMHHVPYTYVLHSGKTVIQHIYDAHYEGAKEAEGFVGQWDSLKGKIDEPRYSEVLHRLQYQAGHAVVWRDAVCNWFLRESGIPDVKGRVGNYPGRIEAESMTLDGYRIQAVTPWEAASGGKAVICGAGAPECSARFQYQGQPGWYDVKVQYFDQNNGSASFRLSVAGQVVAEWVAADSLPTAKIDAHSATQYTATGVALRPGDEIVVRGSPDRGESAAIDYVEIRPARH
jgi:alpha-glucuronidase